jgi:hypothetical protein
MADADHDAIQKDDILVLFVGKKTFGRPAGLCVAWVTCPELLSVRFSRLLSEGFTLVIRGVRNPQLNSDAGV